MWLVALDRNPEMIERPPALFVADATSLDFLNSIATPVDKPVEWITSGEDLLDWLKAAGLVPDDVREGFLKSAVPGELDGIAAQARALREWFREFVSKHMGKPLQADALKELVPLNRILIEKWMAVPGRAWLGGCSAVGTHRTRSSFQSPDRWPI
jgi:hypothetical protein